MTRGDAVFEISRAFGLDDTVNGDELKLMQRWWSRGIIDVLVKTHCFVDIGSLVLQSGITDYRLTTDILAVDEITVPDSGGTPVRLEVVPMANLLPYLGTSVAPGGPYKAAIEGSLMRVAPVPSSAATLTYIFVPRPTLVAADGTTTLDASDSSNVTYGGIPSEFDETLLAYMAWKAADYDDKTTALRVEEYRKSYEGLCKDTRKQGRRKAGRGMHGGCVGYPGSTGVARRNDVYPNYNR